MALPELLPFLKGWYYLSDVRGQPAQQQPFIVQANQSLVIVPSNLTGYFLNAKLALNSLNATVNFVIDGVTTRTSAAALAFEATRSTYAVLGAPVIQSYDVSAPSIGPISIVNYDVTTDPIPFRQNVQVYLTSAQNVTVVGSEVNLCIITDPAAFADSYRSVVGTAPPSTARALPIPYTPGGR